MAICASRWWLPAVFLWMGSLASAGEPVSPAKLEAEFGNSVRPILAKYCLGCHSTKLAKGDLDLERFATAAAVRKDIKPWPHLLEQVSVGEMPPTGKPQPSDAEKKTLVEWTRRFIEHEARMRKGDPGHVPLRRLSNTEYNATVRDLTGVDLQPAREFPADGAGGEGFTNAGESLSDITPALLTRYLAAAKEIADRAVLLPDGFRFSPSKSRRDWTDEGTAALRKFYASLGVADGKLNVAPYVGATLRHRKALAEGQIQEVAAKEKLNAKYLGVLWHELNAKSRLQPLASIEERWRQAEEKDAAALAADIAGWQMSLWKVVRVGNYIRDGWGASPSSPKGYEESLSRQVPYNPPVASTARLKVGVKLAPGQEDVKIYLVGRDTAKGSVLWHKARFEGAGKPTLLLKDYASVAPAVDVDYASAFGNAASYLLGIELVRLEKATPESVARERQLETSLLLQWAKVLALTPAGKVPGGKAAPLIPPTSTLGQWRSAVEAGKSEEASGLAQKVQQLLSGPRPADEKSPDRVVYDRLVSVDSPLWTGVDLAKIAQRAKQTRADIPPAFLQGESVETPVGEVTLIRLPAALFVGREFVVDVQAEGDLTHRLVRLSAATTPPDAQPRQDSPILGKEDSVLYRELVAGHEEFRQLFPLFLCFPAVVPTDEVVTLKMFHREDEPLIRLFLSEQQTRELDRLWERQRFVSRQAVAERDYLPQFMAYTTQDTPKGFQQFFIDRKPVFEKDSLTFLQAEEAAIPQQLKSLMAFAEKAYRRPMQPHEQANLHKLYETIRKKGAGHEEALRGVLARILTSPAFLFRIEAPGPGAQPGPISDWELASRLSYFLWSSMPDEALRQLAAEGKLGEPATLEAQARRMLADPRARQLAIEFGTQWIHVREFDQLKEKNEKLFPTFTPELRNAIYEESILFFQDLFKNDRPIVSLLTSDATHVNGLLAKHYGIPGIEGAEWKRIEGIRKYGRGGLLGLASVQAKQAGASRTSPVLRGNWVVETLLGEKLPRPPANVPILPDQEGSDQETTRQKVERHVSDPSCAACHVRIDPFGFAFEHFDAIGRYRQKETNGLPVDPRAKLRDGTEFSGIDGLRTYLLEKKKEVIVRLFCQRLLGYALGRSTTLSDTATIDDMVAALERNEGRVSAALAVILNSPQFRQIRGREMAAAD